MTELIKERNKFPPAHPSVWLGGEYISITDISRDAFVNIMSMGLQSRGYDRNKLLAAYDLSKISFNGQDGAIVRSTGERYFDHVKAVSFIGTIEMGDRDPNNAIARLFHDNDEDTRIGSLVLLPTFGKKTSDLVNMVTNPRKTGDEAFDAKRKKVAFLAMREFPEAGKIKSPDRTHNNRSQEIVLMYQKRVALDTLTQGMLDKSQRKAEETREYIYPLVQKLGGKYLSVLDASQREFETAIRELKDSVKK